MKIKIGDLVKYNGTRKHRIINKGIKHRIINKGMFGVVIGKYFSRQERLRCTEVILTNGQYLEDYDKHFEVISEGR